MSSSQKKRKAKGLRKQGKKMFNIKHLNFPMKQFDLTTYSLELLSRRKFRSRLNQSFIKVNNFTSVIMEGSRQYDSSLSPR